MAELRVKCARVADLAEVRSGIQKGPHRVPQRNPVRYLTVAHVQRNRISLDDPRYFEVTSEELDRWRLKRGDVLIIEGNGSADQIGRAALFRGEIDNCVHQNHVIRVRPNPEIIDPEYLNHYLNSPIGQDEVQRRSQSTSGLRTLSTGRIKEIEVPLLPLSEQRRIVARIEELSARIERALGLRREAVQELETAVPAAARAVLSEVTAPPTRLKHWLDPGREGIQTGPFGAQLGTADFTDSGVPVLTISNVQYSGLNLDDLKFVSTAKAQ